MPCMCRRLFCSAEYRELSFLLRAVKLATFIKNRWHLGAIWSFCNLLSFTPSFPSFFFLRHLKICRLRSGGALSVLYWYNWGPRPYQPYPAKDSVLYSSPIHLTSTLNYPEDSNRNVPLKLPVKVPRE